MTDPVATRDDPPREGRSPSESAAEWFDDVRRGLSRLRRALVPSAAEDLPLLPSAEHTMLVTLAALVGLSAGIATTFLRVFVRLSSVAFFRPEALLALTFDASSPERARLVEELGRTDWHPELLGVGGIAVLLAVGYGVYRHVRRRREGGEGRELSRAFLVAGVLTASIVLMFSLHFLTDVADALGGPLGVIDAMDASPFWAIALVAVVGGSLIGWLAHRFRAARGHGVPDVMEGVALHGGKLRGRDGPIFAATSGLTAASMGSVGLEGPVVYFGATTASGLGQALKLSRSRLRVLAAAGAAAGISASFNAPVAGALFALEIIIGDFALAHFSPVVIASVVGTVVYRSIDGNHPVLGGASFTLVSGWEILLYVLLGLACGVVGTVFVKTMEGMNGRVRRVLARVHPVLRPAVVLLFLGTVAAALGRYEALGAGYDSLDLILAGKMAAGVMAFVVVGKIVFTALTLASGCIGGILFPTLLVGAATGGVFGAVVKAAFGEHVASPSSYAVVGMGGVLTAVHLAPLTAAVIVFEFTNDYTITLPLLVSCIIATLLAQRALGANVYQRVLRRAGVLLTRGREQTVLRSLLVKQAMKTEFLVLRESDRLRTVADLVQRSTQATFPVVDDEGALVGALRLQDLRPVMFEPGLEDVVVAGELCRRGFPTITPERSLAVALTRFSLQPFEHLIVVDEVEERRVVGLLSLHAAMDLYQERLKSAGLLEVSLDDAAAAAARADETPG